MLRFSVEEANKAFDEWGFNCGPGAICAMLDLTPEELRPNLFDFEKKKYTNPKLMKQILKNCGAKFTQTYRGDAPHPIPLVDKALIRIQWGGPWTEPNVPMRKRQRHTHWIGVRNGSKFIFDINAMCVNGWIPRKEWEQFLVPWLLKQVCPDSNRFYWPTHVLELK